MKKRIAKKQLYLQDRRFYNVRMKDYEALYSSKRNPIDLAYYRYYKSIAKGKEGILKPSFSDVIGFTSVISYG